MREIHFLIANLDRRPDRYAECTRRLREFNVPDENIIRCPAHDHLVYDQYEQAAAAITHEFNDLPHWLSWQLWELSKSNFCWAWTWYSILHKITTSDPTCFYILLVDDCCLYINYHELQKLINRLYNEQPHSIFIVFLGFLHRNYNRTCHNAYVQNVPEFFHGTAGGSDSGTLYAPRGAQFMMTKANQLQKSRPMIYDSYGVSCELHATIHRNPPSGIFTCSDKLTLSRKSLFGVIDYYPETSTDPTQNRLEIPLKD